MKETLHCSNGKDQTRICRAFGWVVTFRDFPAGSYQTVDGDSMMTQALTLFTKGRAEFYLDGVKRGDRVPGILSSEHEVVGEGGTFEIRYVEPTSRVCIPRVANKGRLPTVKKHMLEARETINFPAGTKLLVCLGQIAVNSQKLFDEERTAKLLNDSIVEADRPTILLEFLS